MDRLTNARQIRAAMTSDVEMMAPAATGQGQLRSDAPSLASREDAPPSFPASEATASSLDRQADPPMSPSSWTATAAGRPRRGLPRLEGHRRGVEAVRRTVRIGDRARRPLPDALQLLDRELAPAAGRGRRPDGPAASCFVAPRPRRAARATACASGSSATATVWRRTSPACSSEAEERTRRQYRADPGRRLQLRRSRGDRCAPCAQLAEAVAAGRIAPEADRHRDDGRAPSTPPASPIPIS